MPHMPSHIAKGAVLMPLENKLNTPANVVQQAQALRALLTQSPIIPLDEVYRQYLSFSSTDWRVVHLKNDWFGAGGWWPPQQPISPVVRHGFVEACDHVIAGGGALRFDCYWVCTEGAPFEVWVGAGRAGCVTVIVSTPEPPGEPPASWLHGPENIWVVRRGPPLPGELPVPTPPIEPGQPVTVVRPRIVAPPPPA